MKTQIKAQREETNVQQAGSQQDDLSNYPHASFMKGVKAGYESMYAAVEKISDPVSFTSLKAFYNIL